MSSPGTRSAHLLHADEDQLDRAATLLRSGTAFVVAVCPPELRPAALARLRGKVTGSTLPDPVEIGDAWKMLDALVEQVERRDRVLSLTLGQDVMSALDGLNLHREKVLRGGPVILWLPDVDALMKMRERAPDAFSFRSTMVMVTGDGGALPLLKGEESEEVARGRRRLKRAKTPLERAAARSYVAEHLRVRARNREAESEARAALNELTMTDTEESYRLRASLCLTMAGIENANGRVARELHWHTRALAENTNVPLVIGVNLEVMLRSTLPGPDAGLERVSVRRALEMVRSYGLGPEIKAYALRQAVRVASALGDFRATRAHMLEWMPLDRYLVTIDRAYTLADFGRAETAAGDLASAEAHYREAAAVIVAEGGSSNISCALLCQCLLERGEITAARSLANEWTSDAAQNRVKEYEINADIEMERGDVTAAVAALHEAARQAEAHHADAHLVSILAALVGAMEQGTEAERVSLAETAAARVELARGEAVVLAFTTPDPPPWYPINFLTLRARALALTPDTLSRALVLARQARDLAPTAYPDLLPETGRTLADILLRAGQPDEALAVIADIEPEAASRGFLRERARLLADRVLALVQRGDAPSTLSPHLAAFREALAATDAPRITAETLRDLAKRLPPTATTPDPHALAEEALGLFVAMPMPAQEARCLEIMGDGLRARGNPDEARRRYLAARARLERYGLGLRRPLLNQKIDALT